MADDDELDPRLAANRRMWDERVAVHVASRFYDVEGFRAGASTLRDDEIGDVGSVDGRSLVHLQCHFGLDTLSWARRGATVTGLDFSPEAVDAASALAAELGIDARFVCANVYDAVEALGGTTFDVVYTGLGALNWLPDLDAWAGVVATLLRPGGTFLLTEFHPVGDLFADDDLTLAYDYFGDGAGLRFDDDQTYTDGDARLVNRESWEWIHPVSRVVTSLREQGLHLEEFREFEHTHWQRWPFLIEHPGRIFGMPEGMPSLPLMYSMRYTKPA